MENKNDLLFGQMVKGKNLYIFKTKCFAIFPISLPPDSVIIEWKFLPVANVEFPCNAPQNRPVNAFKNGSVNINDLISRDITNLNSS